MAKRTKYIAAAGIAALAAIVAGLAITSHSSDPARGTQSDSHVGTSTYPQPKVANHAPPAAPIEAIISPNAIPALSDVNASCPMADARGNKPPSLQDDSKGAQEYSQMPQAASTNTFKCAIARAKAAGYTVADNSVKCAEETVQLLDTDGTTLRTFRPFCMQVGQTGNPTCMVTLIPTDYQGNFLRQSEPDLSRLQDFLARAIIDEDPKAYANC